MESVISVLTKVESAETAPVTQSFMDLLTRPSSQDTKEEEPTPTLQDVECPLGDVVLNFVNRVEWTWEAFGRKAGVSGCHVRYIGTCGRHPSLELTRRLSTIMDTPFADLLKLLIDQRKLHGDYDNWRERDKVAEFEARMDLTKAPIPVKTTAPKAVSSRNFDKLRAVLAKLEWSGGLNELWQLNMCPECGRFEPSDYAWKCVQEKYLNPDAVGHAKQCAVAVALKLKP